MYLLSNIITTRGKGSLYNNPTGPSPCTSSYGFEPWVAGFQLKLDETRTLTNEQYETNKVLIHDLVENGIIELQYIKDSEDLTKKPVVKETEVVYTLDLEPPVVEVKKKEKKNANN